MALVHSFVDPDRNEARENMEYYSERIVTVKEMLRMMKTRLLLANASGSKNKLLLPHNDATRLEHDLMEVLREFQKLCMNRQLHNIALQKSVQSSLLHTVSKNLFTAPRLNYIEDSVVQNMRLMMEKGEEIRSLKEEVDEQFAAIAQKEDELLNRRKRQYERLSASTDKSTSEDNQKVEKDVDKTMNNMNKLSQLLTILVMQGLTRDQHTPEEKVEMVQLAAKWRTSRSYNYYCA